MFLRPGAPLQPVAQRDGEDGAADLEPQLVIGDSRREPFDVGGIGRQDLARDVTQEPTTGDDDVISPLPSSWAAKRTEDSIQSRDTPSAIFTLSRRGSEASNEL